MDLGSLTKGRKLYEAWLELSYLKASYEFSLCSMLFRVGVSVEWLSADLLVVKGGINILFLSTRLVFSIELFK